VLEAFGQNILPNKFDFCFNSKIWDIRNRLPKIFVGTDGGKIITSDLMH
jgi:hypothetical protein